MPENRICGEIGMMGFYFTAPKRRRSTDDLKAQR